MRKHMGELTPRLTFAVGQFVGDVFDRQQRNDFGLQLSFHSAKRSGYCAVPETIPPRNG